MEGKERQGEGSQGQVLGDRSLETDGRANDRDISHLSIHWACALTLRLPASHISQITPRYPVFMCVNAIRLSTVVAAFLRLGGDVCVF